MGAPPPRSSLGRQRPRRVAAQLSSTHCHDSLARISDTEVAFGLLESRLVSRSIAGLGAPAATQGPGARAGTAPCGPTSAIALGFTPPASARDQVPGRRLASCRHDALDIRANPDQAEAADVRRERSRNFPHRAVRRSARPHRGNRGHFRPARAPIRPLQEAFEIPMRRCEPVVFHTAPRAARARAPGARRA